MCKSYLQKKRPHQMMRSFDKNCRDSLLASYLLSCRHRFFNPGVKRILVCFDPVFRMLFNLCL